MALFSIRSSVHVNQLQVWQENVIAVVILLRILARSGSGGSLHVKSFIILRSGEGLTSFNINNRVNFSWKQKQNEALSFFVVVVWVFIEYGGDSEISSSKLSLLPLILIKRRRWFKLLS